MKVHIGPYRKNQKVSVKIDKYDVWSLDWTLANIIHPALVLLKEAKHGTPFVDEEDLPDHLKNGATLEQYHYSGNDDDLMEKKWEWVIDEMIFAFDHILRGEEKYLYDSYSDKETWYKELQAAEIRCQNGLVLFGKYFRTLWD